MLRVLQIIGKMDRAGAETILMNIYRNIDRSKVQFDFMVFTDEKADYDEEILELGGNIYHMPAFKGYNYGQLCRKFKLFFGEHSYEIVHGHIGSLAPAYLKYAKEAGSYTIAHSHGPNSNVFIERLIYAVFAYKVRYVADYFFACSRESGIDRFGDNVVESDRFEIINNAIDSQKYQYSKERHEKLKEKFGLKESVVIGHVGRFVPSKNHRFIVEVFEDFLKLESNAILMLVGDGGEKKEIQRIVDEKGLSSRVIFGGVRGDIPDIMNLFDVFLFPSLYEGLGIVGIEAQAAGLPCFFSEAIPNEAIATNNVWKYPLSWSASKWAEEMKINLKTFERKNTIDKIENANFDIIQIAKNIEEFYLEHSQHYCL